MRRVATALISDPGAIAEPLRHRMKALARQRRFEEAAEVRDRGAFIERTLTREAELHGLLDAGDIVVECGGRAHLIRAAQLAASVEVGSITDEEVVGRLKACARWKPIGSFWPPSERSEAVVVASWLRRNAADIRLLYSDRGWALPAGARPTDSFLPVAGRPGGGVTSRTG